MGEKLVQSLQNDQLILTLPVVFWISFDEYVGIEMLHKSIIFISIFGHALCVKQYF